MRLRVTKETFSWWHNDHLRRREVGLTGPRSKKPRTCHRVLGANAFKSIKSVKVGYEGTSRIGEKITTGLLYEDDKVKIMYVEAAVDVSR